mmetsp:Transcript_3248/g.10076  ORF Transcript_3248/g.10076 Transcript_3248/m.10076 type:complete len:369 (-) Transcript_3248:108-1214(-)
MGDQARGAGDPGDLLEGVVQRAVGFGDGVLPREVEGRGAPRAGPRREPRLAVHGAGDRAAGIHRDPLSDGVPPHVRRQRLAVREPLAALRRDPRRRRPQRSPSDANNSGDQRRARRGRHHFPPETARLGAAVVGRGRQRLGRRRRARRLAHHRLLPRPRARRRPRRGRGSRRGRLGRRRPLRRRRRRRVRRRSRRLRLRRHLPPLLSRHVAQRPRPRLHLPLLLHRAAIHLRRPGRPHQPPRDSHRPSLVLRHLRRNATPRDPGRRCSPRPRRRRPRDRRHVRRRPRRRRFRKIFRARRPPRRRLGQNLHPARSADHPIECAAGSTPYTYPRDRFHHARSRLCSRAPGLRATTSACLPMETRRRAAAS